MGMNTTDCRIGGNISSVIQGRDAEVVAYKVKEVGSPSWSVLINVSHLSAGLSVE